MRKILLLSLLLSIHFVALCQQDSFSYRKIVEKMSDKAWLLTKVQDDRSREIRDETYFFFKSVKAEDYRKDSLIFRYSTHHLKYNSRKKLAHVETNVCNPTIIFFNSSTGSDSFAPILIASFNGVFAGDIVFKNDSEFVLNEYRVKERLKAELPRFDTSTIKKYFRLGSLPDRE